MITMNGSQFYGDLTDSDLRLLLGSLSEGGSTQIVMIFEFEMMAAGVPHHYLLRSTQFPCNQPRDKTKSAMIGKWSDPTEKLVRKLVTITSGLVRQWSIGSQNSGDSQLGIREY